MLDILTKAFATLLFTATFSFAADVPPVKEPEKGVKSTLNFTCMPHETVAKALKEHGGRIMLLGQNMFDPNEAVGMFIFKDDSFGPFYTVGKLTCYGGLFGSHIMIMGGTDRSILYHVP